MGAPACGLPPAHQPAAPQANNPSKRNPRPPQRRRGCRGSPPTIPTNSRLRRPRQASPLTSAPTALQVRCPLHRRPLCALPTRGCQARPLSALAPALSALGPALGPAWRRKTTRQVPWTLGPIGSSRLAASWAPSAGPPQGTQLTQLPSRTLGRPGSSQLAASWVPSWAPSRPRGPTRAYPGSTVATAPLQYYNIYNII